MMNLREELKNTGVKVTFNDFIMRAAALALKEHPVVNSGFDAANNARKGVKRLFTQSILLHYFVWKR